MNALPLLFATSAVALVIGCSPVGPNFKPPTPPISADTSLPSAQSATIDTKRAAPVAWWRGLNDRMLSGLIERGLTANFDLAIAEANLTEARALLRQDQTRRQPTVTGDASAERGRAAQLPSGGARLPVSNTVSTSVDLSWELDVFGRIRRQLEARRANAAEAEALREDAHRIVAADIALAYVDLREAQQRILVAERNQTNQRETVNITQVQVDAGSGSQIDLVRAQQQLLTTQATLPRLKITRRTSANRITALLGLAPGALDKQLLTSRSIPSLPNVVTVGSAKDMLRQRPDIRAAEQALARSTAQIGVTTADLFPTISLSGRIGATGNAAGDLSNSSASFFGLGPSLSVAIFNRSEVHARIAQGRARNKANLAVYQRTVVTALEEADNVLAGFVEERARLALIGQSVAASRRASELARIQFQAGSEPFLTVLDSEAAQLLAEDERVISRAARARALINVYKAFGGGYVPASNTPT